MLTLIAVALSALAVGAGAPLAGRVVALDPGHPSETSGGCRGPSGLTEVRVNWLVARELEGRLRALGARVVLTKRRQGETVANRRRAELANEAGADLLLRLHCDAGARSGFAVYYPDREGTRFGVTGPAADVRAKSEAAARKLEGALRAELAGKLGSLGVLGDSRTAVGLVQGALTGSIFSEVPVVTVEMGVLENPADERFLASVEGRRLLAAALASGVAAALEGQSEPRARSTRSRAPTPPKTRARPAGMSSSADGPTSR